MFWATDEIPAKERQELFVLKPQTSCLRNSTWAWDEGTGSADLTGFWVSRQQPVLEKCFTKVTHYSNISLFSGNRVI